MCYIANIRCSSCLLLFFSFFFFFWMCASVLPLMYDDVAEVGCNWCLRDINIFPLSKKEVAHPDVWHLPRYSLLSHSWHVTQVDRLIKTPLLAYVWNQNQCPVIKNGKNKSLFCNSWKLYQIDSSCTLKCKQLRFHLRKHTNYLTSRRISKFREWQ
jgi:hypothetical protein